MCKVFFPPLDWGKNNQGQLNGDIQWPYSLVIQNGGKCTAAAVWASSQETNTAVLREAVGWQTVNNLIQTNLIKKTVLPLFTGTPNKLANFDLFDTYLEGLLNSSESFLSHGWLLHGY